MCSGRIASGAGAENCCDAEGGTDFGGSIERFEGICAAGDDGKGD